MSYAESPIRRKPVFKTQKTDDLNKFKELPVAPGHYPYRLNLENIVPVPNKNKIVFHMAGDTGSIYDSVVQDVIAGEMSRQITEEPVSDNKPLFLYHLGDVVYKYGEAENYSRQFFKILFFNVLNINLNISKTFNQLTKRDLD